MENWKKCVLIMILIILLITLSKILTNDTTCRVNTNDSEENYEERKHIKEAFNIHYTDKSNPEKLIFDKFETLTVGSDMHDDQPNDLDNITPPSTLAEYSMIKNKEPKQDEGMAPPLDDFESTMMRRLAGEKQIAYAEQYHDKYVNRLIAENKLYKV